MRAGVTALCLAAWLLLVALDKAVQWTTDPLVGFEHPVEVLVRSSERALELGQAATRAAGPEFGEMLGLEAEWANVVELYDTSTARIRAAADAGAIDLASGDLLELEVRAASIAHLAGLERPAAEGDGASLARAARVAFGDEPAPEVADPEAAELIDAARAMRPGAARTHLLDVLGRRLDRDEEVAPDVLAAEQQVDARLEPAARLLAIFATALLPALGALAALLWLSPASVRLDPPTRPQRWPASTDGVGLFARYVLGLVLIQSLLALTVGPPALGLSALIASLPLLAVASRRFGGLGAALRRLGVPASSDRLGRLVWLPLGAWIAALAGLVIASLLAGPDGVDPFANPFLDMIVGSDDSVRLRLMLEACLWAPLFEELGFRAALFGGLRSRMGFLPAAAISSAAFGVAHAYDPLGVAAIVWVGFVLAYLFERTRSLTACIIAHALFNFGQLQLGFLLYG
jgi:membrane protease YdiL (CAAX protease family)